MTAEQGIDSSEDEDATEARRAVRPSATGMALLAALGLANALTALFQWTELVAQRSGGDISSTLGEHYGAACIAVWNSSLAVTVQTVSGVPIAGWGLIFSLVAFVLPLWALTRRAGQAPGVAQAGGAPVWPAVLVTALAGLTAVIVLGVSSARTGALCASCLVTYALVLSYALVAFLETEVADLPSIFRGISLASAAVALAYVLLFIPGLRTPEDVVETHLANFPTTDEQRAAWDEQNAAAIEGVVRQMRGPRLRQFSQLLQAFRDAEPIPLDPPRALIGARNAPLRLTHFTDTQCANCSTLHSALARLRTGVPLRSFSVEPRFFPMDAACNPTLEGEPGDGVRCIAARAQICVEGEPDRLDLMARFHREGRRLDEERIYQLAERMIPREVLAACIASPETEAKLQADIASAVARGIEKPPLLLLNGRQVAGFGPLLYSLIFAEGDPGHPALANLDVPPAQAHRQALEETGNDSEDPAATDADADATGQPN